jgi:hypothetical protein
MKTERFKHFLEEQKKEMEKYKWDKGVQIGCDPGQDAIDEWIKKYAKKYRKEFALNDFKSALTELGTVRNSFNGDINTIKEEVKNIQDHLEKILMLNKIVNSCEERLLEGLELLETEKETNGNGN